MVHYITGCADFKPPYRFLESRLMILLKSNLLKKLIAFVLFYTTINKTFGHLKSNPELLPYNFFFILDVIDLAFLLILPFLALTTLMRFLKQETNSNLIFKKFLAAYSFFIFFHSV